jgi:hypothetical protein
MIHYQATYYQRELMARVVFGWLFLILVYFFYNHSLLAQLQSPVLIYPASDNSFWILHILRIPQFFLQHHWAALLFDMILTSSCIICFVVPTQKFFTYLTIIGVWLFYFIYSSAAGKHYAQIGYILMPVALLAFHEKKFELLWKACRYWICLLYFSGGIYKIYYGGFAFGNNMSTILQQMNAEWFIFNGTTLQAKVIAYLIAHPGIAQWLYKLATVVDISLVIGVFTKRFDKWLLIGLLAFHVGNYFLLHISFVEQSLIFAPFLPWQKIHNYFQSNHLDDGPLNI